MESELAKTLRAMSDDHRMVPDFSEKLLDIADAIERQAKEIERMMTTYADDQEVLKGLEQERDSALAASAAYKMEIARLKNENDRLRRPRCIDEPAGDPCKFCGAREATDVCRDGTDHIIRERDAARAEVERLKVQRDKAMAIGGVNFCAACGDEPVLEELQDSDIPGLGRTFCQKCRVAIGQSDLAS